MSTQIKVLLLVFIVIASGILGYWFYKNRNQKSVIEQNIEDYVKKYAHNPESYEPIKTECKDTFLWVQKLKGQIEDAQENLSWSKSRLRYGYKKEYQKDLITIKLLKAKLDSVLNSPNPKSVYQYIFLHQCRGKVPLGGMMLKNYLVVTDPNLNIITLGEEQDMFERLYLSGAFH